MQALTVGCEFAFLLRLAPPGLLVAFALFPDQPLLARFPDATVSVVVARVGRSSLPIHFALQAADPLFIGTQFLTQDRQTGLSRSRHQGKGRGSQVRSDRVSPHAVFRFVVGDALQRELHAVPVPLTISPLRLRATGLALQQAGILDAVIEAMFDDRVPPVDQGEQVVVFPDENPLVPIFWSLQLKTQSGIIALV